MIDSISRMHSIKSIHAAHYYVLDSTEDAVMHEFDRKRWQEESIKMSD